MPSPKQLHILLLEDLAPDAELIQRELRLEGRPFTARRVWTEADFVAGLREPGLDLILADHALPSYDGLSALRLAQQECPEVPFIFVSGSLGEELAIDSMLHGATDYVLKQRLDRLRPAVRRALREAGERRGRRQAEAAVARAKEDWERTFDAVPDLISIIDVGHRIVRVNRAMAARLGRTPDQCVGLRCHQAVHGLDQPPAFCPHARLLRDGQVQEEEVSEPRLHGDFLVTTSPLRDAEGRLTGSVHVARDITEHKRAKEKALSQASLLDLAQDAIIVRDMAEVIQFWNQGAVALYGWTAAEAIGRKITDLIWRDPEDFRAATEQLLQTGKWAGEVRQRTKALREITVSVRWTLVRDAQGQPQSVLAINTDITEKKQLEAQFLRAQRLEGIGLLASGIAHDLNNILAPILMAAPMLRGMEDEAEAKSTLDMIVSNVERGRDIIRQLLIFGRGLQGERAPIQLRHLVKDMGTVIRETFPRNIAYQEACPSDLWPLIGDATQLHQVLLNLCVNARDAMPQGGKLTLRAANRRLDEPQADRTPDTQPGPYVVLEIEDTGQGIPKENLERIFDPFFTTKPLGQGTGLGLSTVLGIVKSHGGFLQVESTVGQGTRFIVHLPAKIGRAHV